MMWNEGNNWHCIANHRRTSIDNLANISNIHPENAIYHMEKGLIVSQGFQTMRSVLNKVIRLQETYKLKIKTSWETSEFLRTFLPTLLKSIPDKYIMRHEYSLNWELISQKAQIKQWVRALKAFKSLIQLFINVFQRVSLPVN
jgi:hypothetical protein